MYGSQRILGGVPANPHYGVDVARPRLGVGDAGDGLEVRERQPVHLGHVRAVADAGHHLPLHHRVGAGDAGDRLDPRDGVGHAAGAGGEQVRHAALRHDPAVADHHEVVRDLLHLVQPGYLLR